MAKLSLKGICSLSHQIIDKDGKVNIHNIEMNQDDFEDCVMLTIEEAKGILWDLRDLYKQTYGYEWIKNEPWFDEFKKRIEKAEGK